MKINWGKPEFKKEFHFSSIFFVSYLTQADLRHSHASLLISKLGAQPLMVAERLGYEKIQTTLNTYSHLYPNQARDLADQLNGLNEEDSEEEDTDNAGET